MIFFNTKLHFIHTNRLEAGVYLNTSQLAVISSVKKELTLTASLLLATAEKSNNRSIEIPQNSFALVPQVTYKSINFWVKVKSLNLHRLYIHHMAGFFSHLFRKYLLTWGSNQDKWQIWLNPARTSVAWSSGKRLQSWCSFGVHDISPAFLMGMIKPRVLGCTRLHMVAHGGTFRAIKHNYSQVQASSSKGKSCWGWILRNPNLATHASPSRLGHKFAFPHIRLHRGKPHFWSMCGNTMPSPSDLSDIILVSAS